MIHALYLKFTTRERKNGKMVDVGSVSVCRCGQKFTSDSQLKAHIHHPDMTVKAESADRDSPAPATSPVDSRFSLVLPASAF
jgi:hypothetical protein